MKKDTSLSTSSGYPTFGHLGRSLHYELYVWPFQFKRQASHLQRTPCHCLSDPRMQAFHRPLLKNQAQHHETSPKTVTQLNWASLILIFTSSKFQPATVSTHQQAGWEFEASKNELKPQSGINLVPGWTISLMILLMMMMMMMMMVMMMMMMMMTMMMRMRMRIRMRMGMITGWYQLLVLTFAPAPYHLLPAQAFGPNLQPKTRSGRSIAQAKPLPSENAHLRPRVDHLGQLGDCLVQ